MMPTAARMASALSLAAVAWLVSGRVMAILPEHTAFGYFVYVNLIVAALCGWFVIGKRLGGSYSDAIGTGLTGMAAMVFWVLFLQAANEMLRLAMLRRFDGPVEALVAIFQKTIDFGVYVFDVQVLVMLVVGGGLVGLLGEWVDRNWS